MFRARKKLKTSKIGTDTLIGKNTEIYGDIRFNGGVRLHVDGSIKGNVVAEDNSSALLTLSKQGSIEGEVRVPNIVLDGTVLGDVHASEHIELACNARVTGNVYYSLIEMAMGAEVNGNLVRSGNDVGATMALGHDEPVTLAD